MVHLTNYITKHQDVHVHEWFPKPAGNNPRQAMLHGTAKRGKQQYIY